MLRVSKRLLSSAKFPLQVSPEVAQAIQEKKPVVSLESTIITHGLPYPRNLEMAQQVEQTIRDQGCIPATVAFVNGVPKVGLNAEELEYLAQPGHNINKVSRRDIAVTMAQKLNGGTTISGTMILSHMAGIDVFATGGLGGVHRGDDMDISADLDELGRTPVAVVCAGPKAILDIPRTIEYLETKGCFVGSMGQDFVPAFYTRDSGIKAPYRFDTYAEAANIIHNGNMMGLQSGYLMCIPPPLEYTLDKKFIDGIIDEALLKADQLGVQGKKITPFLLSEIAEASKGQSVSSNIGFVLNNAKSGAMIAKELSYLMQGGGGTYHPVIPKLAENKNVDLSSNNSISKKQDYAKTLVIGSIALDTHCLVNKITLGDSNPGKITSTVGGVGHNVCLAATLTSKEKPRLVSAIGDDAAGKAILNTCQIDTSGILVDKKLSTAQYISFHEANGELHVACADMDIATKIPLSHLSSEIARATPLTVCIDANLSVEAIKHIIFLKHQYGFKLVYEPVSQAKAGKITRCIRAVYPENEIYMATPTVDELLAINQAFDNNDKYELDYWFPVVDAMQVDKNLPNNNTVNALLKRGVIQSAVNVLPYIPRLLVKDGANGVYMFSLHQDSPHGSKADYSMVSVGRNVYFSLEHYTIPDSNVNVQNVTGAGDTLVGLVLEQVDNLENVGHNRSCVLNRAQLGAKLSVEHPGTISPALSTLQ